MTSPSVLVVVGASAGGVDALSRFVAALPRDIPAAVLVVLHVSPSAPSLLPDILARVGSLPAAAAADGVRIEAGHVYVAPPDQHLLVADGHARLVRGPRENGHRPSVDALFRSAARAHGARVIGVVLTGTMSDGAHGLAQVKRHGGTVMVQSPEEALHAGMPRAAIAQVQVDHVLPLVELAAMVDRVAREPRPPDVSAAPEGATVALPPRDGRPVADEVELDGVGHVDASIEANEALGGRVAPFTCPECKGTVWEIVDGMPVRFRCRVGHSYDEPAFVQHKDAAVEAALWTALTALEENASIARRVAERNRRAGRSNAATHFAERATLLEQRAQTVRDVLLRLPEMGSATAPGIELPPAA